MLDTSGGIADFERCQRLGIRTSLARQALGVQRDGEALPGESEGTTKLFNVFEFLRSDRSSNGQASI